MFRRAGDLFWPRICAVGRRLLPGLSKTSSFYLLNNLPTLVAIHK